jgi:hypothetical protein
LAVLFVCTVIELPVALVVTVPLSLNVPPLTLKTNALSEDSNMPVPITKPLTPVFPLVKVTGPPVKFRVVEAPVVFESETFPNPLPEKLNEPPAPVLIVEVAPPLKLIVRFAFGVLPEFIVTTDAPALASMVPPVLIDMLGELMFKAAPDFAVIVLPAMLKELGAMMLTMPAVPAAFASRFIDALKTNAPLPDCNKMVLVPVAPVFVAEIVPPPLTSSEVVLVALIVAPAAFVVIVPATLRVPPFNVELML